MTYSIYFRLVPTIPLRLNYILWLEDLLGAGPTDSAHLLGAGPTDWVHGLDVGTGASCVYPLIGARKNKWKFTATEADDMNYEFAKRNVERNQLHDSISGE